MPGLEPGSREPESRILPLYYIPLEVGRELIYSRRYINMTTKDTNFYDFYNINFVSATSSGIHPEN